MSTYKPTYEIPTSQSIYNLNSLTSRGSRVQIFATDSKTGANTNSWIFPLPSTLEYGSEYKWTAEELGHVATKLMTGIQSGMNSAMSEAAKENYNINKMARGVAGFIDSVYENTATSEMGTVFKEEAKRQLLKGTSALLGNPALVKEWTKNQGKAYNPNEQLYFDGVPLREFSLSFSLTPLSSEESNRFALALQQLRQNSSPDFLEENFYFTYPDFFDVLVYIHGRLLMKRKKCALVSLNVNLAPDGQITWHEDGRPISYELTLGFKESIIPTKKIEAQTKLLGV